MGACRRPCQSKIEMSGRTITDYVNFRIGRNSLYAPVTTGTPLYLPNLTCLGLSDQELLEKSLSIFD